MTQKILVLDDEENYAEMLESLLEQHLFIVDSAVKPELALKALEQKGYDLVISDYKMPIMDGADFLQKAREINPDLPFIIVSGLMNTPELVKVANMGVTLVLEKPIDIENFIAQVRKFVQPVSEEEYHRSRKAEDGGSSSVTEKRKFIKTYPADCKYISDKSPAMQFFLQDLWDSIQEQNHIFVRIPQGAEIELMLAEVNRWRDADGKPTLMLDSGVAKGIAAKNIISYAGLNEFAPLVGVRGFSEATLEAQESLVDALRDAPDNLSFIYFIEEELIKNGSKQINDELAELLHESLCVMPPLVMRPSDFADYLLRYVPVIARAEGVSEPAGFSYEAYSLLLGYNWPGNFAELIQMLRFCVVKAGGVEITAAHISNLIHQDSDEFSIAMLRILQAQERMLIDAMESSGASLKSILDAAEVSPEGEINTAASLPLLFPDLTGK